MNCRPDQGYIYILFPSSCAFRIWETLHPNVAFWFSGKSTRSGSATLWLQSVRVEWVPSVGGITVQLASGHSPEDQDPSLIFNTGRPRCIALHFLASCRCCVFYKLKVCGNPALSKSIGAVFATFAHFVSLCHIFITLTISQNFFITIIFAMVICDVRNAKRLRLAEGSDNG